MAYKPLSEVDKLELQIIAEAIAPPGTPPCQAARRLLTGGHLANVEAIRNGGALFDNVRGGDLAAVTLPTDGDYRLEIRSSGNYTVGVMIR